MKRSSRLVDAVRDRTVVGFTRPFEEGTIAGLVLDVGPRWFLLAVIEDACRYDGFQCFRISDVRDLETPHSNADFIEKALTKRSERMPPTPQVNVQSIEELLTSASRAFPLVTIHREAMDTEVCQIGRIQRIGRGQVSLLEIDAGAIWEDRPTQYRLKDITRVDFGGMYEDALHVVGGPPPNRN